MDDATPRDEEGLLLKYDVVICGTGFVQSILASALARAGQTVLHCDAQGYYGELDAVLTLPFMLHGEVWEDHNHSDNPKETITQVKKGRIQIPKPRLRLHSTNSLTKVAMEVGTLVETPYGSGCVTEIEPQKLKISLDSWTLANGSSPTLSIGIPDAVDTETYIIETCRVRPSLLVQTEKLLQHQSRSFAIDVTPALIFGSGAAVLGFLMSNVSEYVEFKSVEGMLWLDEKGKLSRVPCSKGDVFGTKLLNPLEKRKLMKFLQLVMDYATSEQAAAEEEDVSAAEEVHSLNERQLNQGRSLSRPQNKAVKMDDLETLKAAVLANEMNFDQYLTETQKLSPSLKALVRHALTLETGTASVSIGDGMRRLCQHLQGLGKFGSTAFLAPMYGSGEFPQAFCRSAAVHGATYLLRRNPKCVVVEDAQVTGVVISGPNDLAEDKTIACDHIIVPPFETDCASTKHLLRRVSIVNSKIIQDSDAQRHIILIPPKSKIGNDYAIHGIVFDSSAKVAPPDCTLLHLTTTVEGVVDDSLLEGAVGALLPHGAVELYHVSFSYPLDEPATRTESTQGLHICVRIGQTFAADDAFVVAKGIFDEICPDVDFLALSEKMDNTVKENRLGREEEDEERDVLDKAAQMLEAENKVQRSEIDAAKGQEPSKETDSTK